jgi:hypothetical protein
MWSEDRSPIALESILSQDDRPSASIRKIDGNGQWLPYPGITVIMAAVLSSVHQQLYDTILEHLPTIQAQPLPLSSLHCTLCNVRAQARCKSMEDYNEFVTEHQPRFERLKFAYAQSSERLTFKATVGRKHPGPGRSWSRAGGT